MRTILICLLVLPLSGCMLELLTTTAIQGELAAQNASAVVKQKQYAQDQINRTQLNSAIGYYTAETGHYPPNLRVLAPNFIAVVPTQPDGTPFPYDPFTGKLAEPTVPAVTAGDREAINALRDAIDYYGDDTGYYPANLDQLVPNYIANIPTTSTGQPFIYNPQDGMLTHPATTAPRHAPANNYNRSMPTGGGAGPLGTVMTGIGIQQQLGNMNNSGTAAAGAIGRQQIGNIQDEHNRRQQEALDELGF